MISTILKNEAFVKQLERVAKELEYLTESETDFSFFLPKLLLNIEGLMKMYHPDGSNSFDYFVIFDGIYKKLKDIELKVWKEGHELMVFEKIKNKLGYLVDPNEEKNIENNKN